ncbi:MAG: diguanylate cyclase [Candidatus Ozemobacteraceae bacterium]
MKRDHSLKRSAHDKNAVAAVSNINAYLLGNLVLIGILLIVLLRGEGSVDATIRLPGMLVLLVILNTILIFRESLLSRGPLPGHGEKSALGSAGSLHSQSSETSQGFPNSPDSPDSLSSAVSLPTSRHEPFPKSITRTLRRILAERESLDDTLLPDALTALLEPTGDRSQMILLFEEGGHFSALTSAGPIPTQASGVHFFVSAGELRIRHPGNLGEELICRWGIPLACIEFVSAITHLHLKIVPLSVLGAVKALWIGIPQDHGFIASAPTPTSESASASASTSAPGSPAGRAHEKRSPGMACSGSPRAHREGFALWLEGLLALVLLQSRSAGGQYVDVRTGLLRFEGFKQAFETEIERSERYGQQMTLMLLSLARFDEFPAPAREALQRAVAGALRESLRRLDLMFLWDKPGVFAGILTETNPEVARMVADRVLTALRRQTHALRVCEGLALQVHVGTATYPGDATHGDGLLEKSSEALAHAVREGIAVVAWVSIHGDPLP